MENNQPITNELVETLISVVNKGLCKGMGNAVPGQMCVEAADLCLDVLKEMKSPGCEWLYLINQYPPVDDVLIGIMKEENVEKHKDQIIGSRIEKFVNQ